MARRSAVNDGLGEAAETARRLKVHSAAMRRADKSVQLPPVSTVVPGISEGRAVPPKRLAQQRAERGWNR